MDAGTWTQVGLFAAQLIVLTAAAIFARGQVNEARKLREAQIRPFVVVDLNSDAGSLVFLEVMNMGATLARDVRIEIDPPLASALDINVGKLKMLNEGIATMAPGKKYRTFFDTGQQRGNSDLPMSYVATVTYTGEPDNRTFEETMNLDLDLYMDQSDIRRHGLHDIHAQLGRIERTLRDLNPAA